MATDKVSEMAQANTPTWLQMKTLAADAAAVAERMSNTERLARMYTPSRLLPQNIAAMPVPSRGAVATVDAQFDQASYVPYRRQLESGGRADAKAGTSSASGIDQFTGDTWLRVVNQAKPAWAEGLSKEEILRERFNPQRSGEISDFHDADNIRQLERAKLPVNRHTVYAMHHFGAPKGKTFARASMDTRMEDILTKAQLDANKYLKGKTKAQAIANWDDRAGSYYGLRVDGTEKGSGFLGELAMTDGSGDVATEISVGVEFDDFKGEIPLLVPGQSQETIQRLLAGGEPTDADVEIAIEHAAKRLSEGKSVFMEG